MTALNSFIRIMTGPKCLRSALRQKTVVVHRLMTELNSPTELQVSIPLAVFGGDIFGVMSEQLRDALVVQPPANATVVNAHQRRSLLASGTEAPFHSKNSFPPTDRVKRSTLPSESLGSTPTNVLKEFGWDKAAPSRKSERSSLGSSQTSAASSISENLVQDLVESRSKTPEPSTPTNNAPATNHTPNTATLVNSLNCYWQSLGEQPNATRVNPATDLTNNTREVAATNFEQQASARVWPTFIARDALKNTGSFNADPQRADQRSLSPARADAVADPQNDFKPWPDPANNHVPDYDDLSDRLAEILHEQALQHGIDVT